MNKSQNIDANNYTKAFVLAKKQHGLRKRSENPESCGQPKGKTFHWQGLFFGKQNAK